MPSKLCGVPVDDLFAYTTTKSIKIRDARLGLLHYSLILAILFYILVYQLIGQLGYLSFSEPQGTARLTLQEPTVGGCNPNEGKCMDDFSLLSNLSYCCASTCSRNADGSCNCGWRPAFKNYDCTFLGGDSASMVRESSILVTTFTHQYEQKLNSGCYVNGKFPAGANNCSKVWLVTSDASIFTADIEHYTVLIDHSVMVPDQSVSKASRTLNGTLYVDADSDPSRRQIQQQLCASRPDALDSPGGAPTSAAPCYLKPDEVPHQGLDFFTVGLLLQAMGVSLETESFPGSGHSVRYEGMIANLVVEYTNTRRWHGLTEYSYVYRPALIDGSTYKATRTVSTQNLSDRSKQDLHGILFQYQAGGKLAVWSITQLLVQLTTSLTLLAMSTVGVNILAQYVLRLRHYYSEALYDRTADFTDLSFLEQQPDEVIEDELKRRNLPLHGSKYLRVLRLLDHGWKPPASSPDVSATGREVAGNGRGVSMARPMLQSEP